MSKDDPQWLKDVRGMSSLDNLPKYEIGKSPLYKELQGIVEGSALMNGRTLVDRTIRLGQRLRSQFLQRNPGQEDKISFPQNQNEGFNTSALNAGEQMYVSIPFVENPQVQQLGMTIDALADGSIGVQGIIRDDQERIQEKGIDMRVLLAKSEEGDSKSRVEVAIVTPSGLVTLDYFCDERGEPILDEKSQATLGCYRNNTWYEPDFDMVEHVREMLGKFGLDK